MRTRRLGGAAALLAAVIPAAVTAAVAANQDPAADAVLGEVQGQPILASDVLQPCEARIARVSATDDVGEFHTHVTAILHRQLEEELMMRLIAWDAEQALDARQFQGLQAWTATVRRNLIDEYGAGNPDVAERALREKGLTLEREVQQMRRSALVQQRLDGMYRERLRVTPDETREHYDRNPRQFREPARYQVRLIRTNDAETAARIDRSLASGIPFVEVADTDDNRLRRTGLQTVGEGELAPALDAALARLAAGEYSSRIEAGSAFWWVFLESSTPAREISYVEAAPQIERRLLEKRRRKLMNDYTEELLGRGSYTPVQEMLEAAVTIAVQRYTAKG